METRKAAKNMRADELIRSYKECPGVCLMPLNDFGLTTKKKGLTLIVRIEL